METPQQPGDPNEQKPALPRRNSGGHVELGLEKLENYANNPLNHDPGALQEVDRLNLLYHMPSRRAEERNTPGAIGNVDAAAEVDPLNPDVPYAELGSIAANPNPDFDHIKRSHPQDNL